MVQNETITQILTHVISCATINYIVIRYCSAVVIVLCANSAADCHNDVVSAVCTQATAEEHLPCLGNGNERPARLARSHTYPIYSGETMDKRNSRRLSLVCQGRYKHSRTRTSTILKFFRVYRRNILSSVLLIALLLLLCGIALRLPSPVTRN